MPTTVWGDAIQSFRYGLSRSLCARLPARGGGKGLNSLYSWGVGETPDPQSSTCTTQGKNHHDRRLSRAVEQSPGWASNTKLILQAR